jgi:hypothetical protein
VFEANMKRTVIPFGLILGLVAASSPRKVNVNIYPAHRRQQCLGRQGAFTLSELGLTTIVTAVPSR